MAQAGGAPFEFCRIPAAGAAESVPSPDPASEVEGGKVPVFLFGELSRVARIPEMAAGGVSGGGGGIAGGGVAERGDCRNVAGGGLRGRGLLRLVARLRGGRCRAFLVSGRDECPPHLFRANGADLEMLESLDLEEECEAVPLYDGTNLDFFKENVFPDREEILRSRLSKRQEGVSK